MKTEKKTLTKKQIETIKKIKWTDNCSFHGNKKTINGLNVSFFCEIVNKKRKRKRIKELKCVKPTILHEFLSLVEWSKKCEGTSYQKILIEGKKNIYYASPVYLHSDYNKSIFCEKNEKTIKFIDLFQKLLNK